MYNRLIIGFNVIIIYTSTDRDVQLYESTVKSAHRLPRQNEQREQVDCDAQRQCRGLYILHGAGVIPSNACIHKAGHRRGSLRGIELLGSGRRMALETNGSASSSRH